VVFVPYLTDFFLQGQNILLAQYIFALLYVLNLGLVFRILGKIKEIPLHELHSNISLCEVNIYYYVFSKNQQGAAVCAGYYVAYFLQVRRFLKF
jgi:hypothetical protein